MTGPWTPRKGLLALPPPRPGDLFLDLEGDPFAFDDGIDYLFGILELPAGRRRRAFHGFWARDADGRVTLAAEKAAFERTVDFIMERLRAGPGTLHVYHYAAYERTALRATDGSPRHARGRGGPPVPEGVLVDLVSRGPAGRCRASVESYSIKRLEPHYGYVRERDLRDANSAIAAFEAWLEDDGEAGGDPETAAGHRGVQQG